MASLKVRNGRESRVFKKLLRSPPPHILKYILVNLFFGAQGTSVTECGFAHEWYLPCVQKLLGWGWGRVGDHG